MELEKELPKPNQTKNPNLPKQKTTKTRKTIVSKLLQSDHQIREEFGNNGFYVCFVFFGFGRFVFFGFGRVVLGLAGVGAGDGAGEGSAKTPKTKKMQKNFVSKLLQSDHHIREEFGNNGFYVFSF